MEKKYFSLVKSLKYFRVYVLPSKITSYLSCSVVKYIFPQPDDDGRMSKWITQFLEYDMEIKPTKIIKGQGLDKILTKSNCKYLGVNYICQNVGDTQHLGSDPQGENKVV